MTAQLRKEFEAVCPPCDIYTVWVDSAGQYRNLAGNSSRQAQYQGMWEGWKAAKNAQVCDSADHQKKLFETFFPPDEHKKNHQSVTMAILFSLKSKGRWEGWKIAFQTKERSAEFTDDVETLSESWHLVPYQPTPDMIDLACKKFLIIEDMVVDLYQCMLDKSVEESIVGTSDKPSLIAEAQEVVDLLTILRGKIGGAVKSLDDEDKALADRIDSVIARIGKNLD